RFDPGGVGWRRVVDQNLGFVRLNRKPFTVGSATAVLPNESHGINPCGGNINFERGVGYTPPCVEASQSETLESVSGILSHRNPETVIAVDAHGVKQSSSRKLQERQNFLRRVVIISIVSNMTTGRHATNLGDRLTAV